MTKYAVRYIDGPFAGKTTILTNIKDGYPGDKIRVWKSILVEDLILCDDKIDELYSGDCVYQKITESELPGHIEHPNLIRGGQYKIIERKRNINHE